MNIVQANITVNNDIELTPEAYIENLIQDYVILWHMHWNATNNSYHLRIEECMKALYGYIDTTAEQALGSSDKVQLTPICFENIVVTDPIEHIYNVKLYVSQWLNALDNLFDGATAEGFKNAASGFIEELNKFIYLFRLCK